MSDEEIGVPTEPEEVFEPTTEAAEVIEQPMELGTPLCTALKRDGTPCRMVQKTGTRFCRWHQPDEPKVAEPQPKATRSGLKPYPFHDGGVNENIAIRVIRMVIPQCPIDSTPELKQKDNTYRPNPNFTGEQNCQQVYKRNNQGVWDVEKCVSLGHDPWYTRFRRPILEEVLDEQGFVIDTKVRYQVEKRLNVIQVSLNQRHSNGMEVALAQAKGCKFLEDFGIASPCEFRNCSQPQRIDTRYGKYCSERHARLVAADARHIMLPVGGDPYSEAQAMNEREQMLEQINIRKGA